MITGLFYFIIRFFIDCHLLLNLYRKEIDSSGKLIHNICRKVIGVLAFFQICVALDLYSKEQVGASLLVALIFCFTIIFYIHFNKRFLRAGLFVDEEYITSQAHLKKWRKRYGSLIEKRYDSSMRKRSESQVSSKRNSFIIKEDKHETDVHTEPLISKDD